MSLAAKEKIRRNYDTFVELIRNGRVLALHEQWYTPEVAQQLRVEIEKWRTDGYHFLNLKIAEKIADEFAELTNWDMANLNYDEFIKAVHFLQELLATYKRVMEEEAAKQ